MMTVRKIGLLIACLSVLIISSAHAGDRKEPAVQLDTVVVTSQKQKKDKQEVPSNITVYDDVMLEDLKIDDMEQVYSMTPNVGFVASDSHYKQVTFRGIGGLSNMNKVFNVNVDGVTLPYVATDMLLDVDRIEILRGSQGALYGRNTHAGGVNVHTKAPGDTPVAKASISYGTFKTLKASTAFGTQLTDKLSYRLALAFNRTDGYVENAFLNKKDTNDDKQITARGKIKLDTDDLGTFTLGMYADAFDGGFDSYAPEGAPASRVTENNETGYNDGQLLAPSLTWDWDLGGVNMTSITSFSSSNYGFLFDWDYTRWDLMTGEYDEVFTTFSQELRFTGGEEAGFKWLLGAFLLIEDVDTFTETVFHSAAGPPSPVIPGDFMRQDSTVKTRSGALFGQGVYKIIPQLELTAALRVDYEEKSMDWENSHSLARLGMPTGELHQKKHWLAPSPSVSIAWIFDDSQRVYASVGQGFKAGDYNNVMQEVGLARKPVDPEFTTTYEVGYKGRHFDNRFEFNAALFYADWKDMQVDVEAPIGMGMFNQFEKKNAGEAHSIGLEIDSRAVLADGWEIFGGLGYMFEYEFDEFRSSSTVDFKGKKLPVTPEYTMNLGSIFRMESGFFLSGDIAFRGPQYFDPANRYKQKAYSLLNAKVGYEGEHWEAYLYGKNLNNANYTIFAESGARRGGAPRTLGAELGVRF